MIPHDTRTWTMQLIGSYGGMSKKWQLVDGIELGLGSGYGLAHVAVIAHDHAFLSGY
jgi:hypothetical protein